MNNFFDYSLVFVILFLACFGLVMIYSASYYSAQLKYSDGAYFLKRQALWLIVSVVAMLLVSRFDYHFISKFWFVGWVVANVLMCMVNFTPFGVERNGKKRWLGYHNHSIFQPTELVKIALILVMAVLIDKMTRYLRTRRAHVMIAVFALPPLLLVAMNNLSSGIIIAGIVLCMYLVATRENRTFFLILAGVIAVIVIAKFFTGRLVSSGLLKGYQMRRILVWNNPEAYPQEGGYQVLQGLYAIGSGGLFGKGLGNSIQKLGFIPEAQNDMIFSVICEELGLFGAVCVILLFLFMLYRFLMIANNAPDLLGSMIVIGVMVQISLQVFLNVAVVTNFVPNTGVSLPFISYGGTSLLFLMAEMGMVLGISRQIKFED